MVVVAGCYDHVESVLGALEVPHLLVQPEQVDSLGLRPEQLLIVNCPGQVRARRSPASAASWRPAAACSPPTGRSSTSSSRPSRACSRSADGRRPTMWCASRSGTTTTSTCRVCSTARTTRSGGWRARSYPITVTDEERVQVLITSREPRRSTARRRWRCGSAGAKATSSTTRPLLPAADRAAHRATRGSGSGYSARRDGGLAGTGAATGRPVPRGRRVGRAPGRVHGEHHHRQEGPQRKE